MKRLTQQLVSSAVPDRMLDRLEAMRLTLALAYEDGRVIVQNKARPIEELVATSGLFVKCIKRLWPTLTANRGKAVEVMPGVWVVPMPVQRRRTLPRNSGDDTLAIVVLVSPAFLETDRFRLVCDQQRVDLQATSNSVDRSKMISMSEVHRLATSLTLMQDDLTELDRRTADVYSLSQQLGESYEELSLVYKLSTNMAVDQPPQAFLAEACRELQEVVGLRWMAILIGEGMPGLSEMANEIVCAGDARCSMDTLRHIGRELLERKVAGSQPRVIDDTSALAIDGLPDAARHLLVVSLLRDGKPFGMLFGGDKIDGTHIGTVDSKLCSSLANSISIFLQNTMLYEDMQAMFLGTLHALTSSIDAKDSYTHGHSERVALMSRLLAEKAGIDEHIVDRVYIAGLIHDVGKIGVPEAVLCKPGHLTDEEFELIKMHPRIGARILQDIQQMQDLIPGVLHHHERWDGRGYPDGLKAMDIPLFGRLIGLADAFDAMSSNRTYRQAMDHDQVMAEIRRCSGTQFDPDLAKIFVTLDLTPLRELIVRHQLVETNNRASRIRP